MKANEAPERIILSADRDTKEILDEWVVNDYTDNIKIEYIRTDTFVEKACEFIRKIVDIPHNIECKDGQPLVDDYIKYAEERLKAAEKVVEDFKKYMEGE